MSITEEIVSKMTAYDALQEKHLTCITRLKNIEGRVRDAFCDPPPAKDTAEYYQRVDNLVRVFNEYREVAVNYMFVAVEANSLSISIISEMGEELMK